MQVILILDPVPPRQQLASLSHRLGAALKPLHSGTDDPALRKYFAAEVSDGEAEAAAARVRNEPGVEAAYTKPADFPPG